MATFSRSADRRYVFMVHGNLRVEFDTWFGGAPLVCKYNNQSIIQSHPGEGFQHTIEEGQDLTQATANGETAYEIARVGDTPAELAYKNYYIREVLPANWPSGATYYKVVGFYPDFWLSAEAPDDSRPPKANGQLQDAWKMLWTYSNHQWPTWFSYATIPFPARGGGAIFFESTPNQTAGILMEGNEMIVPAANDANWNQRLREISNGRIAFRCRISLKEASANSVGGVMFCRSVPTTSNKNMDDAFNSPGYFLNINKSGLIELRRHDNVVLWSQNSPTVAAAASTVQGCLIELRTTNNNENQFEIWIEKTLTQTVNLTPGTRIKGPNVGLFASTDYSTSRRNYIKFSDREIFNVGTEVEATLTALSDGSAETDLFVHNAGNVSEGRKMYRINTVSFLLPGVGLDTIWTEQPRGTYLNPPSNSNSASYLRGFLSAQQPPPHPRAAAFWAGNGAGTLGLYCVPTTVEFAGDNVFTRGEHGLVSAFPSGFGSERILHINALPLHTPGNPPWTASGARLKAKWWGVRTP